MAAILYFMVFVASNASVQLLRRQIPDFELNALRYATPIIPWIIWVRYSLCMSVALIHISSTIYVL